MKVFFHDHTGTLINMDTDDIPEYFEICYVDQINIDFLSKHLNNQNEISNKPIISSKSIS